MLWPDGRRARVEPVDPQGQGWAWLVTVCLRLGARRIMYASRLRNNKYRHTHTHTHILEHTHTGLNERERGMRQQHTPFPLRGASTWMTRRKHLVNQCSTPCSLLGGGGSQGGVWRGVAQNEPAMTLNDDEFWIRISLYAALNYSVI